MSQTSEYQTESSSQSNAWYVRRGSNALGTAKSAYNYLPTSTTQATQIYTAYKLAGIGGGATLATTLALDKALIKKGYESKHYASLSAFWGYVGYKAVMHVNTSNMDFKYKAIFNILFASVSVGMVGLGKDSFKGAGDTNNAVKSILFTAKMLDNTNVIDRLEKAYDEGGLAAAKYSINNLRAILANPFIQNALAHQGLAVVKNLLMHKLVTSDSVGLTEVFNYMQPNAEGMGKLTKLMFFQFAKKLADLGYDKLQKYLSLNVTKQIELATAEKVFDESKSDVIAATEGVDMIAYQMDAIQRDSMKTFTDLSEKMTLSLVNTGAGNPISAYPTLFLLNALTENIFSPDNVKTSKKFLEGIIYSPAENPLEEFEDIEEQDMGQCKIRVNQDVQSSAFRNLQEISVMGGLPFMLERIKKFIQATTLDDANNPNDFTSIMLNSLKDMLSNLAYAMQFGIVKVSSATELLAITHSIEEISSALGISGNEKLSQNDTLESLKAKMEALAKPKETGPKRVKSNGAYLELSDYDLFVREDGRQLVHIDKLQFGPGIYAIKGKIGTGKTTLLTDVAGCLSGIFDSKGTISYPTGSDGEIIPKIFCRIKSFSFPKVSFFEKLTYGIPHDYVDEHKDELIKQAKELFHEMGQGEFIDKIDFDSRKKIEFGSTGQEKMTIIISAILRKLYLDTPVLLALDETLANLDDQTRDLVCNKIKEVFSDSIILSVDHQAGHNPFYEHFLDLSMPEKGIVSMDTTNIVSEEEGEEAGDKVGDAAESKTFPIAFKKITFENDCTISLTPRVPFFTKEWDANGKSLYFILNQEGVIEASSSDQSGSRVNISLGTDIELSPDMMISHITTTSNCACEVRDEDGVIHLVGLASGAV